MDGDVDVNGMSDMAFSSSSVLNLPSNRDVSASFSSLERCN